MTSPSDAPRRSALYVPASNRRALDKARGIDADVLIFDLEDAVAPDMRTPARAALQDAFGQARFGLHQTVIRVNESGSDDLHHDLDTVARCQPDAVLLPKVSRPEDLHDFAALARTHGVPADTELWAMIETGGGLLNLRDIVAAGRETAPRLRCLVVGTNDIMKETGVSGDEQRKYLVPWLMNIVLTAKQGGLAVLDGVWNDFSDLQGFEAEAVQSARMAFDGKTLIHPSQVPVANRVFSPSIAAVERAHRIVAAFGLPEHAHAGAINLEGGMVERLHLTQAQRLLAAHATVQARNAQRPAASATA